MRPARRRAERAQRYRHLILEQCGKLGVVAQCRPYPALDGAAARRRDEARRCRRRRRPRHRQRAVRHAVPGRFARRHLGQQGDGRGAVAARPLQRGDQRRRAVGAGRIKRKQQCRRAGRGIQGAELRPGRHVPAEARRPSRRGQPVRRAPPGRQRGRGPVRPGGEVQLREVVQYVPDRRFGTPRGSEIKAQQWRHVGRQHRREPGGLLADECQSLA
jgi:hypothetical protein